MYHSLLVFKSSAVRLSAEAGVPPFPCILSVLMWTSEFSFSDSEVKGGVFAGYIVLNTKADGFASDHRLELSRCLFLISGMYKPSKFLL